MLGSTNEFGENGGRTLTLPKIGCSGGRGGREVGIQKPRCHFSYSFVDYCNCFINVVHMSHRIPVCVCITQ